MDAIIEKLVTALYLMARKEDKRETLYSYIKFSCWYFYGIGRMVSEVSSRMDQGISD